MRAEDIRKEALGWSWLTRDYLEYVRRVTRLTTQKPATRKPKPSDVSGLLSAVREKILLLFTEIAIKAAELGEFTVRELCFQLGLDEDAVWHWVRNALEHGVVERRGDRFVFNRSRALELVETLIAEINELSRVFA